LNTDLFDYALPERLIAQHPAAQRDASRLLVVNRQARTVEHRHFQDLPEYLREGDCLFRNNAAVIPARLAAKRPTGGQVECLLLRPAWNIARGGDHPRGADEWWCLLRPGKKLPIGATFSHDGLFTGTVREKTEDGLVRVWFESVHHDILKAANQVGEVPLPPYIIRTTGDAGVDRRREEKALASSDRERYQTVYANHDRQVAVAAPTAGLHFTPELFDQLSRKGVVTADLTLHVGLATFRPIMSEQIENHSIHHEVYEIGAAAQRALFATKGRRVAVGTTSVRTMEDFLDKNRGATGHDLIAEARIFIYPPRAFRGVDALITNFHQPRSTLLCLVAAFLAPGSTDGIKWLQEIYADAVAREYRFFSYGDAMLIL